MPELNEPAGKIFGFCTFEVKLPGPVHKYVPFSTYDVFNSIVSPSHNLAVPVMKADLVVLSP